MIGMRRRLAAAFAAGMLALAPVGALADNSAIAINTKNNSSLIETAFKIERVVQDVVTTTNAAVAVSSCSACQTVAIAIDVVFVQSDPTVYKPVNVAVAENVSCTSCATLADAYQFVISTGGAVRLTPRGQREIHQIREQLEDLERCSGCSILDLQARVDGLVSELKQVLSTQLVPVPPDEDRQQPEASPTPEASPSGSPSPQASEAPAVASSPSPAASPSPSPRASSTP